MAPRRSPHSRQLCDTRTRSVTSNTMTRGARVHHIPGTRTEVCLGPPAFRASRPGKGQPLVDQLYATYRILRLVITVHAKDLCPITVGTNYNRNAAHRGALRYRHQLS